MVSQTRYHFVSLLKNSSLKRYQLVSLPDEVMFFFQRLSLQLTVVVLVIFYLKLSKNVFSIFCKC